MQLDPESKEILKNLLFVGVGAVLAYLFNKKNNIDQQKQSKRQQKEVWLKQFDIFQAEPLLELFKKILIVIEKDSYQEKIINEDIISQLKAEIVLVRFFDRSTIDQLKDLLSTCIDYNYYIGEIITGSLPVVSTETSDITTSSDNINKTNAREEDLRKRIKDQIVGVTNTIRKIYPKENLLI